MRPNSGHGSSLRVRMFLETTERRRLEPGAVTKKVDGVMSLIWAPSSGLLWLRGVVWSVRRLGLVGLLLSDAQLGIKLTTRACHTPARADLSTH